MHHVYRPSDLYGITVKLNSITDNVLAETMIQDIRGIGNVNSIMTLTIADDKKERYTFFLYSWKLVSWELSSFETY
jgi:hypothetical protein